MAPLFFRLHSTLKFSALVNHLKCTDILIFKLYINCIANTIRNLQNFPVKILPLVIVNFVQLYYILQIFQLMK